MLMQKDFPKFQEELKDNMKTPWKGYNSYNSSDCEAPAVYLTERHSTSGSLTPHSRYRHDSDTPSGKTRLELQHGA